ncbi:ATP-dependent DNA helicase [Dehalobacter sp. DCM]|uniref:ATP-dependent DNA helicase n=1 Tax=Dehalobacter sp. DCM TaxID=2907827 RepID=UPI0030821AFB|nr:ATP-dependent DNA helicase [Dehalobacter sp. DCM]
MVRLPIRQCVELIMRSGDIDNRYAPKDRMLEGARAHRALQKINRERYADYRSEVFLAQTYHYNGIDYALEGRADGVFSHDGQYVIEEIKTTVLPLESVEEGNAVHWAQAKCYACILAVQNELQEVSIQMTYYHLETYDTKQFVRMFTADDLDCFVSELIEKYAAWASFSEQWKELRDRSIKALYFPFPFYRKGQRELAVHVYKTIVGGEKLFVQAPTGTGKTISVLFPAIKAMAEEKTSKIFYLTAKTITRQVAEEAFGKMRHGGLKMKTLTLTAKEKICFCEKPNCHPEYCRYAKGHYDRVNEAILDAVQTGDDLSRSAIEAFARKYTVCPFEFSLDLSLLADCVICDYNYVFDPKAFLRRFFAEGTSDYVFLIDEAHNLVDRSREMFSVELRKTAFYQIKKAYKGRDKTLDKILNSINRYLIDLRHQCGQQGYYVTADKQKEFIALVNKYTAVCERMLKENRDLSEDSDFLQVYFDGLHFGTIADFYDERYVTYAEAQQNEVVVKLFCLDPSYLLGEALQRGRSAVMFSATLSPLQYFRGILGGDEKDKLLALNSPFDEQNLCVITAEHISTKYKERENSREQIAHLINTFVGCKKGNYIIYFPSYKYMHDVFADFTAAYPAINAAEQAPAMTEEERESFLTQFVENPVHTYVAFCVLGGLFSEGIDMVGNRLIGTAIVSVGLPQFNVQQNIIRDYFDHKNGMGFEYAYMYPGMNKVLQAAGRVIRCESDIGAVLLIDERYSRRSYRNLFPKHWFPLRNVKDIRNMEKVLTSFWELK